ncbi:hypothetical protein DSECCO2_474920 [anaerobic digester metagenome]
MEVVAPINKMTIMRFFTSKTAETIVSRSSLSAYPLFLRTITVKTMPAINP